MPLLQDFKKFALRGNVIDLAIGVIIGAAFSKIVTSLVEDVLMPPLGLITGRIDFQKLAWRLSGGYVRADGTQVDPVLLRYGNFINNVVQFLIIAFVIFIVHRLIVRIEREFEREVTDKPAPPQFTTQEKLLMEIRDLMKEGRNQN